MTLLLLLVTGCSLAAPPAAAPPTAAPSATVENIPFTATPVPTRVAMLASLTAEPSPEPVPPTVAPGTLSEVIEYGTSGRREIALTFDAGADRGYAEEILDLLQAEEILASFGTLGQWAAANPDLVQRMVDAGHMLFNHSWSHPSFTGATPGTAPLSREERIAEVQRTKQVVWEVTGSELRPYFRAPFGDIDASVLAELGAIRYGRILLWSCDSRDSLGATADEIQATCIETAQPGRIVFLHVGAQSDAYEALPRMIASLRAQGFAFVTADQILMP